MQIGRIYGSNRHAAHPAHLYLTGLDKDGALYGECVKKNDGFQTYMVCNKTIVDLKIDENCCKQTLASLP